MAVDSNFKTYENCCRTCMNRDSTFELFKETVNSKSLADILISCSGLNVESLDALPKKICGCCYSCLVNFYNFREIAKKMDAKLHEIYFNSQNNDCFDNQTVSLNFINIKLEEENNSDWNITVIKNEMHSEDSQTDVLDVNKNSSTYKNTKTESAVANNIKKKKEKYICDHCNRTYKKLSRLQEHIKIHQNKSNPINDRSYTLLTELSVSDIGNEKEVNKDSTDQEHVCRICSSKFKSVNSLSAHMRVHTQKGRILSCNVCNKVFKKISHLKRHEMMHDKDRQYHCSLCDRVFSSESILTGHMNRHTGLKPHLCPLCPKAFAHTSTLNAHINVHKKDKILCPTCGKKFDSLTNLDQHVKRHLGLKKFECNLCPRKFVSKGELKSHSITHTGEKLYTCDQCGASFTKRSSLGKHTFRHSGIKPHQCDTCSMRFSSKDHLKRHHRIHTGEKPYKCDICERAFTQSNDLVKHRRAHLGEKIYKCTECEESFRLQTELRQHISDHFVSSRQQLINASEISTNTTIIDNASELTNTAL